MNETACIRFWAKTAKQAGGCWDWTAALDPGGYGRFREGGRKSQVRLAHCVAYELLVGPIPADLSLDHLCRNRACVNPDHLEPVQIAENLRRQVPRNSKKTHCPQGHPYDVENTVVFASEGKRRCRTCMRQTRDQRSAARRSTTLNTRKDGNQ